MPLSFHRKIAVLGAVPFEDFLNGIANVDWWHMQETSGAVALATNRALALGRNVASLTYAGYFAPPANWSDLGSEVAHSDGTQGGITSLGLPGSIGKGKTYKIVFTISNISAGNARINIGGAASPFRGANDTYTEFVTAGTANNNLNWQGDVNFIGDIDLKIVEVQQTNIAASSDFPGAELYVTANAASDPNGNEADATTGWASNAVILTSDSSIKSAGNFSLKGIFQANGAWMSFDLDTILTRGQIYRLNFDNRHLGSGGNVRVGLGPTSSVPTLYDGLISADTTFINVTINFMHSSDTRYLIAQERNATNDGGVYIDNISITEANPMNGDNTAAAVGQAAGGNLGLRYLGDGATTYLDVESAEHNSKLDPTSFHAILWMQKDAWDTTERDILSYTVDANNWIRIVDTTTAGTLSFQFRAGGVTEEVTLVTGAPTTDKLAGISVSGGVMKAWYDT
ncbi:MAG TPA: hypothetical protein ENI05_01160, partial [Porticoccus sp.]|nr:hypothetical protein [Porticoccus sp.]